MIHWFLTVIRYLDNIHPFVPILPQSKDRLLEQLHQCSREAQEVFLYALYTVTHTKMDRVSNTFEKVQSFGSAQDHLLFYSRNLPVGPLATAQIVLFQTMLLLILDADTRGPDNLTNKDGIPKGTLFQVATPLGYDLARTYGQAHRSQRVTVADPDADSNIVRRCWVSFVLLSRWYALSVSDPVFMRYDEVGTSDDKRILDPGVLAISSMSLPTPPMILLTCRYRFLLVHYRLNYHSHRTTNHLPIPDRHGPRSRKHPGWSNRAHEYHLL